MEGKIGSYQDLIVWRKAMNLVVGVYRLTEAFPRAEQYGLTSQLRRSAVSVPSNIAEGYRRSTTKNYHQFLTIAFGSASELETQLLIAHRLNFGLPANYRGVNELLNEVLRMLNRLVNNFKWFNRLLPTAYLLICSMPLITN